MVMEEPKSEELEREEECSHIYVKICDIGMLVTEGRRDIGIKCNDCGLEWDIQLKSGNRGASIKLRET